MQYFIVVVLVVVLFWFGWFVLVVNIGGVDKKKQQLVCACHCVWECVSLFWRLWWRQKSCNKLKEALLVDSGTC